MTESFSSIDHFELTLEPASTYYVLILPWEGVTGAYEYTLEIEWTSP